MLAESLVRSAEPLVARHANRELQRLVDRFKDREQIAGVSVYNAKEEPLAVTSGFAQRVGDDPALLPKSGEQAAPDARFVKLATGTIHVVTLPLREDDTLIGTLSLFHDAAYIDLQARAMWRRAFTGVFIQTILIVMAFLLTLRWGVGLPLRRMADWLQELRMGTIAKPPDMQDQGEFEPLTREVTRLATSLTAARAWLKREARLRDTPNPLDRGTITHLCSGAIGGPRLSPSPIANRTNTSKGGRDRVLGSGQRPGDRAGTDSARLRRNLDRAGHRRRGSRNGGRHDRVRVPPDHPQYTLRRVWLTRKRKRASIRIRERRAVAAVPHRAYAAHFPRRGLGILSGGEPEVRRRLLEEIEGRRKPTGTGAGLSLRAAAAHDQGAARRARRHLLAHPVAEPGGVRHLPLAASCWTACWARTCRLPHAGALQQLSGNSRPRLESRIDWEHSP